MKWALKVVVGGTVMDDKEEVQFAIQKRRGVVVWLYNLKQIKSLKRFGLIHYVSRRLKYVVLYVDEEKIEETVKKINSFHYVRRVEISYRPDVEMNFAEKIGTRAAYQIKEEEAYEPEEFSTEIRLAENV